MVYDKQSVAEKKYLFLIVGCPLCKMREGGGAHAEFPSLDTPHLYWFPYVGESALAPPFPAL